MSYKGGSPISLGAGLLLAGLVMIGSAIAWNSFKPSQESINNILVTEGYENIQLADVEYASDWEGCGKGDQYATKFTATKNDHIVNGVVCGGTYKGFTVRVFPK